MFWEGFLRSLTSDLWAGGGVIFTVVFLCWFASFLIKRWGNSPEDTRNVVFVVQTLGVTIVLAVVVILFGRATSVAFANRVPRQDIDKNPVYEQMDSHGQKDQR